MFVARRMSTVVSSIVFATLFPALPSFAQDPPKTQPPTDPVVKETTPPRPPEAKPTETPPPAPTVSPAQLPATLTLEQAVAFALRLQPDVAAAIANRDQANERKRSTYSRYYPRLIPSYTYVNQYTFGTVNQFVGGGVGVIPVQQGRSSENRQAQLSLNYNLLDAGERELSARQARQSARSQEYSEANTRQVVIANVADAYFTVLRNEALVKVAAAQVARAQNTLDVIRAQVEAQVAARKDIFQAEADLLNAQVNLLQARNNAAVSQATLKQTIGAVGGEPLQLAEVVLPTENTPSSALSTLTPVPGQGVDAGADAGLINRLSEAAYQNRPDIASTRQNVEATRTGASLARVETGVQLNLDFSAADQFDAQNFNKSIGNNRQWNLSLSYPLFDGGLVRSQFRANQAAARVAEANLNSQRQQVTVEVEQSYRNLAQTRATLPASAAAVRAAQINYDAAIASQREGVGSIVDVITAQTQLVQAQTNYVQAIYNFYGADARLTRAIGLAERIPTIGNTAPGNASPVPVEVLAPTTTPVP